VLPGFSSRLEVIKEMTADPYVLDNRVARKFRFLKLLDTKSFNCNKIKQINN
jgi:hypothetical protein